MPMGDVARVGLGEAARVGLGEAARDDGSGMFVGISRNSGDSGRRWFGLGLVAALRLLVAKGIREFGEVVTSVSMF